jgi:hypothetical protein
VLEKVFFSYAIIVFLPYDLIPFCSEQTRPMYEVHRMILVDYNCAAHRSSVRTITFTNQLKLVLEYKLVRVQLTMYASSRWKNVGGQPINQPSAVHFFRMGVLLSTELLQ